MIVDGTLGSSDVGFNFAGSTSKGGPATNLACTSCVSKSELNFQVPGLPANQIVVAKSGGDFTTISAAIAAISPTSTNRYVIDVMPGTYVENVDLKSYVHLRGAGREVTTIKATSNGYDVIDVDNLTDVAISGLAIADGYYGIHISSSDRVTISGNKLTGSGFGIYLYDSEIVTITHNFIATNRNHGISISTVNDNESVIIGNTITDNTYEGIRANNFNSGSIMNNVISGNRRDGLFFYGSSLQVSGNMIKGNNDDGVVLSNYSEATLNGNVISGNNGYGLWLGTWSRSRVIHNRITQNGGTGKTDIYVANTTSSTYRPILCFNMYDDITNLGVCVRSYNVTSVGAAAP